MESCTSPLQSGPFSSSRDVIIRDTPPSSTPRDALRADDVIMATSGGDYPPNIAISPGSCKSPYCCTSPGFCNFPFHKYKTVHHSVSATRDVAHDVIEKQKSNLFFNEQVFVPDSAESEQMIRSNDDVTRRFSVPVVHEPFPVIKADQLSIPNFKDQNELIDSIAPISSLSSPASSLSSSPSSIFNENLLTDPTSNDVLGILRLPKIEVMDTNSPFELGSSDAHSSKTSPTFSGGTIRRSPPPPNVTLIQDKHKCNTLSQG